MTECLFLNSHSRLSENTAQFRRGVSSLHFLSCLPAPFERYIPRRGKRAVICNTVGISARGLHRKATARKVLSSGIAFKLPRCGLKIKGYLGKDCSSTMFPVDRNSLFFAVAYARVEDGKQNVRDDHAGKHKGGNEHTVCAHEVDVFL